MPTYDAYEHTKHAFVQDLTDRKDSRVRWQGVTDDWVTARVRSGYDISKSCWKMLWSHATLQFRPTSVCLQGHTWSSWSSIRTRKSHISTSRPGKFVNWVHRLTMNVYFFGYNTIKVKKAWHVLGNTGMGCWGTWKNVTSTHPCNFFLNPVLNTCVQMCVKQERAWYFFSK